jgi:hypothetical protein
MQLECVLALDQESPAFVALAEDAGVNRGICGYAALAIAARLGRHERPTTRAALVALIADVQQFSLPAEAEHFASWAAPVRARRQAYLVTATEPEFAEGAHAGCAAATAGASIACPKSCSASNFLFQQVSAADMSCLLARDERLARVTLVRNVICLPHGRRPLSENVATVLAEMRIAEDRKCVHEEEPFRKHPCANFDGPAALGDNGIAPCCWFVESRAVEEHFASLSEHAARAQWLASSHCCPYVLDTLGHYVAALPLWLDSEAESRLLVFESRREDATQGAEFPRGLKALAAALGAGVATKAH